MNDLIPETTPNEPTRPIPMQRLIARGLILVGVLMIILSVIAIVLINQQQSQPGNAAASARAPRRGQAMSNLLLTGLDGKTAHLSDYKGRPILINIWATWCPPCKEEMPYLQAFYEQHKTEGFVLISLDAGESRDTVAQFVQENGLTFPVFIDPSQVLVDNMGISSFPTSIVIGRDGLVKGVQVGSFTAADLEASVIPYLK